MNPVEAFAALLVVVNVALVARRSVWNYPVAIVAVSLYALIFRDARLYSDMILQGFFLVLNIYGWVNWSRARHETGMVAVETLASADRWYWAIGCVVATMAWGLAMHRLTDAVYPWWDAAIAIVSGAAQLLLARRKLENWVLWIAVDVAAIGLYAARGLWPTAILYCILLGLAVGGLIGWRAALRGPAQRSAKVAVA